jgi:hypothetical protein
VSSANSWNAFPYSIQINIHNLLLNPLIILTFGFRQTK